MGIMFSKVFASLFGSKEVRILILGLDNAGKTTILYRLQADEIEQTVPTIGFNMETLQYKNIKFQVWDLGGQTSIRPYWRCYYPNTDAIIYVVDSADVDRLNIAKQELHAMLEVWTACAYWTREEELKDSILLVFANKQDQKGALNAAQISEAMGLSDIRNRQWSIKETTATEGAGLFDGFDWYESRVVCACWLDGKGLIDSVAAIAIASLVTETGSDAFSTTFPTKQCAQQAEEVTMTTTTTMHGSSDAVWFGAPETWPVEHCKMLYCISRYARQAPNVYTSESWIRQLALLVLLYEGIDAGVLRFDYSPNLVWVSFQQRTERRWLRISQEAKSVIDDLWEAKLVNGIKLSSLDYQPVTVPGVHEGHRDRRTDPEREHPPSLQKLLHVLYDGNEFHLTSGDGVYTKMSGITESEDHVPHRTDIECAARGHSMMIKDTNESLVLAKVRALVGEWMPFGANQIAALNERLGSMERCQGGLFSSGIDKKPTETHFEVPTGLTQVKILDFDLANFINFETEIHTPEEEGVIQIENFGMHLHVSGALLYGVKIDAIMHRTEKDISMDLLSRLLVDVHQDSSEIICDLLSRYQLTVLDMIFMDKALQRNKYNLIMSTTITPKLPAYKYLDRGDRENEYPEKLAPLVRLGTSKNLFSIKDEFESLETSHARRRRGGFSSNKAK
ncbi:hypothetical protein FI667_g2224, partial [Globisporangium splendens]